MPRRLSGFSLARPDASRDFGQVSGFSLARPDASRDFGQVSGFSLVRPDCIAGQFVTLALPIAVCRQRRPSQNRAVASRHRRIPGSNAHSTLTGNSGRPARHRDHGPAIVPSARSTSSAIGRPARSSSASWRGNTTARSSFVNSVRKYGSWWLGLDRQVALATRNAPLGRRGPGPRRRAELSRRLVFADVGASRSIDRRRRDLVRPRSGLA